MIPKLTVYAKYLYLLMVLIVEINCSSLNVQLQSACSNKFVRVDEKDRVIANENSEYPQNFTIQSHTFPVGVRIAFYIEELKSYVCFNKRWQPRLFRKLSKNCYFKEEMDAGYFLYNSMLNPEIYLGFNKKGKPFNYTDPQNIDNQCRRIFKRITEDSSNGLSTSTMDYELTTTSSSAAHSNNANHRNRHKSSSSTRTNQRTHSNRIESSKSKSTSPHSSSKRKSQQQQQQQQTQQQQQHHHVRHHHDQQPLRHYHTTSSSHRDNKSINSNDNNLSSTKQLGIEDVNAIYNQNDSGVNIENKGKHHGRHLRKPTPQSVSSKLPMRADENQENQTRTKFIPTNDNLGVDENNNDTNNCTYSTKNTEDETDDKYLRGRKITKGKNAANANDKPNNKCNNNNQRHRKNNENGRHSRRPSQKSSSHKNQQANP